MNDPIPKSLVGIGYAASHASPLGQGDTFQLVGKGRIAADGKIHIDDPIRYNGDRS